MLVVLCAAAAVIGLVAYGVLAGADFGGGVWDLLASGPRKEEQRAAIARAMGPVWEANHVWLIFVVVIFFSAFPQGWAAYTTALFTPLRIVLVGIGLRGVAFVFRAYTNNRPVVARWGAAFGAASLVTPFLLGACVGAISSGGIRVHDGVVAVDGVPWLSPISLAMGAAGASLCAYLAAMFLTVETRGALQEDFRRRALVAGGVVFAGAALTVPFTILEAPHLAGRLLSVTVAPVVAAGTLAALVAGYTLLRRRYRIARLAAAAQVTLVIVGWALAQYPYVVYPDLTLDGVAAPAATLRFMLLSLPFGLGIVVPSLVWLFRVFKRETGAAQP